MKTYAAVWVAVAAILIIAGVWWWIAGQGSSPAAPAPSAQQTTAPYASTSPAGSGGNLTLGENTSPSLGTYLIANNGMTLYAYSKDSAGVSNCTGICAQLWPPYTAQNGANLVAEYPIRGSIATIIRPDGTLQVTYAGMPLYFYSKDASPGDTTGQGIGGVWHVIPPSTP